MIGLGRLRIGKQRTGERPRFVRLNDVVIDWEANCVLRDGNAISVEPRPMAFLRQLVDRAGEPVSKEAALRGAWAGTHVVDEAIMRAVSVLRAALGDDPARPKFIETVSRRGYRLLPSVRELPSGSDRRRGLVGYAAIALLAGIAGAGIGYAVPQEREASPPPLRAINLETGEVRVLD